MAGLVVVPPPSLQVCASQPCLSTAAGMFLFAPDNDDPNTIRNPTLSTPALAQRPGCLVDDDDVRNDDPHSLADSRRSMLVRVARVSSIVLSRSPSCNNVADPFCHCPSHRGFVQIYSSLTTRAALVSTMVSWISSSQPSSDSPLPVI
jgi:hypothetical protein